MSDDQDYINIEPWPVSELAGHLISQVTLGRRALIEMDLDGDAFERETDRFELESWARLELTAWLTPQELDWLEADVGGLGEQPLATCEQALLIASTIGWALRLTGANSIPALTDGADELAVLAWAPTPWTQVRTVLKSLRVRSEEELATQRERWEVLQWRTTLFTDPAMEEDDAIAWTEAIPEIEESGLWPIVDSDISLDGVAVRALSVEVLEDLRNEAETRLRTLNWVCGYGDRPASAPLELDESWE
jgi:hypothetical protein